MKELKKEKKQEKNIKKQDPQKSLEKILSVEIEIASKVADARERSDKEVAEAQNNLNAIKTEIVENARKERDRLIDEGVEEAHKEAEKKIAAAKNEAKVFSAEGKKFLQEAEEMVINLLLGSEGDLK